MACALLATLYGATLAEFVFAPCQQVLLNQLNEIEEGASSFPAKTAGAFLNPWRPVLAVLLMVALFFVLRVSFSGA